MSGFLTDYGAGLLVCCVGLFFIIMTYGAFFAGRSGVPLCGGVLIAFGFLLTPSKRLALLCFADPGWYMLLAMAYDSYCRQCAKDKIDEICSQQGFVQSKLREGVHLEVGIAERDEELVFDMCTCNFNGLSIPKLYFALCEDDEGKVFLVTYRGGRSEIPEIQPFEDGMEVIVGGKKNEEYTLTFDITEDETDDETEER